MLTLFAKVGTNEKALILCQRKEKRDYQIKLNNSRGGSWVSIGELNVPDEILLFADGMTYNGYNPKIERYTDAAFVFPVSTDFQEVQDQASICDKLIELLKWLPPHPSRDEFIKDIKSRGLPEAIFVGTQFPSKLLIEIRKTVPGEVKVDILSELPGSSLCIVYSK